jgi:hypothetical protein
MKKPTLYGSFPTSAPNPEIDLTDENQFLKLWNLVRDTDPTQLKKVTRGRWSTLSVKAQWQRLVATAVFGPYGLTWGLSNPMYGYVYNGNGDPVEIYVEAVFWAILPENLELNSCNTGPGKKISFSISTDLAYKPGNDSRKKVLTSAMSKALSYIGFSADVYLGLYDPENRTDDDPAQPIQDKKTPPPLPSLNDVQWEMVVDRLKDGEIDLPEKVRKAFTLSEKQDKELKELESKFNKA